MTDIEALVRETLNDGGLSPTPRPDLAMRARRTAQRERRVHQTVGAALGVAVLSVGALVAATLITGRAGVPADEAGPTPSALPRCGTGAGSAQTAGTTESEALRADSRSVLSADWQLFGVRSLPPCDEADAPALPYQRTTTLAEVIWNIPAVTGRHQVLVLSRTTYEPTPTRAQLLANADGPPLLERTRPDGSIVLVYLRANPAQGVRVAVATAPNGLTATVDVPPEGDPLAYGLTVEAAGDLAERLVRDSA